MSPVLLDACCPSVHLSFLPFSLCIYYLTLVWVWRVVLALDGLLRLA
jgi:hypothetical protein